MIARVTTYAGQPEQIEEGLRIFREEVIPWLRDSTGFRGWVVLLDRDNARALGLTFWTTIEAAEDAETGGGALRDEVAASVGALLQSLELYEVAAVEALALDE